MHCMQMKTEILFNFTMETGRTSSDVLSGNVYFTLQSYRVYTNKSAFLNRIRSPRGTCVISALSLFQICATTVQNWRHLFGNGHTPLWLKRKKKTHSPAARSLILAAIYLVYFLFFYMPLYFFWLCWWWWRFQICCVRIAMSRPLEHCVPLISTSTCSSPILSDW